MTASDTGLIKLIKESRKKLNVAHWPEVYDYLKKFNVNIIGVPIYMCTPMQFERAGLGFASGCFIPKACAVFIKDQNKKAVVSNNRFDQVVNKYSLKASIDDVVVHEMLHAVSFLMRRSSNKNIHMEEEFVYMNSIEYYMGKGMSEEDIVKKIFLPFSMQDVLMSPKYMNEFVLEIDSSVNFSALPEDKKMSFLNIHAEAVSERIYNKGMSLGMGMINYFKKNGAPESGKMTSESNRTANLILGSDL